MADADEDAVNINGGAPAEVDLSDETQDFRFLNALNFTSTSSTVSIPKRGEKDFEPHSTSLQSTTLAASRAAMHTALSTPRIHKPKAHQIGVYDAASNMAHLTNPKGSYIATMGVHKAGRLWLLPEEALHLLERGDLDVRWPVDVDAKDGVPGEDAQETLGVPMSLQGAYAAFIGMERNDGRKLTLEMYTVYSALKRGGYVVMRAEDWNEEQPSLDTSSSIDHAEPISLIDWIRRKLAYRPAVSPENLATGPLVKPGLYRNYSEIYSLLTLIPAPSPMFAPTFALPHTSNSPYRLTYRVWKPNVPFKKRSPVAPNFRICVIDARLTGVPTLSQLNDLLATVPYDPPPKDRPIEQSIKHGHRSVIVAVVDQGVTSYLRFSEAGFSSDKLFERKQRAVGGKRGGSARGRGRGRGRGR